MKKILFIALLAIFPFSLICHAETNNENVSSTGGKLLSFKIDDKNSLDMIECPAGSFKMGSIPEEERGGTETLHSVTISKPFYIGKFEVTQSQFLAIMDENPSKVVGLDNPVDYLSYNKAKTFCEKLNQKCSDLLPKGYKFDLPTEAQWEYACRAGTTTTFSNGKSLPVDGRNLSTDNYNKALPDIDDIAWYTKNSNKTTHPVGQKNSNAWDIYDMHGNVAEWCRDWYTKNLGENPAVDPVGEQEGKTRVFRGGSYKSWTIACRSADRNSLPPGMREKGLGFRVALVPID